MKPSTMRPVAQLIMTDWLFRLAVFSVSSISSQQISKRPDTSGHTNNWAVLVDSSQFWFNYRHVANVLTIYQHVKRLGIPDSHIILMMADDMACNPRNPLYTKVYNDRRQHLDVYSDNVEVDYRGHDVTVDNFIRLLTDRLDPETPRSKRLLTDEGSNILIYMTGHGGDGFVRFKNSQGVTDQDLSDAIEQMWHRRRYHEILFIVDSCESSSMYKKFHSPNIVAVASSLVGQDSYSHHTDHVIGVHIIDRYTHYVSEFLETVDASSTKTLSEFFKVCPQEYCHSTVGVREDLFSRNPNTVPVTDFFGASRAIEITTHLEDIIKNLVRKNKNIDTTYTSESQIKYFYPPQFPKFYIRD